MSNSSVLPAGVGVALSDDGSQAGTVTLIALLLGKETKDTAIDR